MSKLYHSRDNLPTIRILYLQSAEIYYAQNYTDKPLDIKNKEDDFDDHFSDLMPINLDLIHLLESEKLNLKKLGEELYTYDFVNVSFAYPLLLDEENNHIFSAKKAVAKVETKDLRKELYLNGFTLNGKKYIRYKRSAGSAKSGSCLFIKQELSSTMNRWSKAGLDEDKDLCFDNLTSYEAYRALSLSSVIKTFELNPYNILFVKDYEISLKDQDVVKVDYEENEGLVAKREKCEVKGINVFDGEGLLDVTVFKTAGLSKGMMLLRNRFFKCCAFNTDLQAWFKANHITSINQLNGITFAKSIKDIVLVVSESCLKYLKMCNGGFNEQNIKRWCDAVSDEQKHSLFGVVKTDKETRFFDGKMVETTYQLLNTLQLQYVDVQILLKDYIDYINKIRNIKETPEYVRFFLQGEIKENTVFENEFEDDSEDQTSTNEFFDYTPYSFKTKVCFDLIKTNKDFIKTEVFKNHLFKNIINSFRLKLYDGRVLVNGTYATLFGNPLEYLKYTIKNEYLQYNFSKENIFKENEICCSFFKNNEELVGSRAPHIVAGNLLYAKNKLMPEIKKWFHLTDNIVVVDALKNNIQQRLNGADYDSDSMLLTNNELIVEATKKNYQKFPVPYAAFKPNKKPLERLSKNKKENIILNLLKIDETIAKNKTGEIVNLSQKLNSHLWNKLNGNKRFDYKELYNKIAILAVLAGAEIDSAKRSFPFKSSSVLTKIRNYAKNNGYAEEPVFFFYVAGGSLIKPKINQIESHLKDLEEKGNPPYFKTTMDYLWKYSQKQITAPNLDTISLFSLIRKDINSAGLSRADYKQSEKAVEALIETRDIINAQNRFKKDSSSYDLEKRNFTIRINQCYKKIKVAIKNVKKAKLLISKIEETATPHSLLYILLYIIFIKENEIGYGYDHLFVNDGGIDGLEKTNDKNAEFVLFNEYYYERSLVDKIIGKIKSLKNT